ncbi:MAG TPA: hypothetical protein VGE40_03370 [Bacilli bacterium]
MDFLLNATSGLLNTMSAALGGWSFAHNIADDIQALKPFFKKANMILPVDGFLFVFGLYISLQLVLMAYYWITRILNLIRGAG